MPFLPAHAFTVNMFTWISLLCKVIPPTFVWSSKRRQNGYFTPEKSFIITRNRRGHMTEPWETPTEDWHLSEPFYSQWSIRLNGNRTCDELWLHSQGLQLRTHNALINLFASVEELGRVINGNDKVRQTIHQPGSCAERFIETSSDEDTWQQNLRWTLNHVNAKLIGL